MSLFSSAMLSLSSCSLLAFPEDQPVIETKINSRFGLPGKAGTMAITPDRRIAIVNFKTEKFCAEGPTEVGRDANSLKGLAASFNEPQTVDASLAAILASSSVYNTLNPRSQGLQYLLGASFANCQLYMNEAATPAEIIKLQTTVLDKSAQLIAAEIPYLAFRGANHKDLEDLSKRAKEIQELKATLSKLASPEAQSEPAANAAGAAN